MTACAACGAENREGARFCDDCGAPLAAAAALREQRKTVTVMFCDVAGSTELGERLDAETFRGLLARYFEEARHVIESHGGAVEKFIGDAVMAVFGVPVVHEDDAARAVHAAYTLRENVLKLNSELERSFGAMLELRIGITTGAAVTGVEERLAAGDAVNVAARLQQAAAPREILLDEQTLALVHGTVTVEELGPLELKGKQRPVGVYRLTAMQSGALRSGGRPVTPIVGRVHERKLLDEALANVRRNRKCSLLTLLGTAGVGKSRLAREFLAVVDATVIEGRCLPYGDGITYWPVVELVKQFEAIDSLLAGTPGAASTLQTLLGKSGGSTTPDEIAWAVRKLLDAAAAERPLVVVFDDIHWAEPIFLDLIESVVDRSHSSPILMLCLARLELLEARPSWGGSIVQVEPMSASDVNELIASLPDGTELEPDLASKIRAAAAGNPLFVEEMLAMVRDSDSGEIVVPPTIRALLAARVDQLEPVERTVLECGSIEGEYFHREVVDALLVPPSPTRLPLAALVRKQLVWRDRPRLFTGDAYRFRHLLIRDAAYDALTKAERSSLHERFANWLETHDDELVQRDEITGYHLERAYLYLVDLGPISASAEALGVRAARVLAAAGRSARRRGDFRAAASFISRAADVDPVGRLALLPELGELLFEAGDLAAARSVLDEALASGDEHVVVVSAVWRAIVAGHSGEQSGGIGRVLDCCEHATTVLERLGDEHALAAVLAVEGRHRLYQGRAREAEVVLRRAYDLSLRTGELDRARQCIASTLSSMTDGSAPVSEVEAFIDKVASGVGSGGEPTTMMRLYQHRALMDAYSGRFDQARENYAATRGLAADVAGRVRIAAMTMTGGRIELLAGDAERAERELRSGFEQLGQLGETAFRSTVATLLAEALLRQGRDDEADEILDEAMAVAEEDDVDPQVRARGVRARTSARRGEFGRAKSLAFEAAELAAKTDDLVLRGNAMLALAEVLLAAGAADSELKAALGEALELFERKESIVQAEQTRALLGATGVARR